MNKNKSKCIFFRKRVAHLEEGVLLPLSMLSRLIIGHPPCRLVAPSLNRFSPLR
jgi:hypothetical protein